MSAPAASVIITHFAHGDLLFEAVASALAQPGPACEVIIVDDGSADDSAARVAARWAREPRLRLLRQENRGQLAAFQAGVAAARGAVLFFLDSDDRYKPGWTAAALARYAQDPETDFIFCAHEEFGRAARLVRLWPADRDLGCTPLAAWLRQSAPGSVTSTLSLRRELALKLFPVPPEFFPDWRTRADDYLVLAASLAEGRKACLAEPWVEYRVHERNAFHGRPLSAAARYRHECDIQRLLHWFAGRRHLSAALTDKLHAEFKTIPRPTRREYALYRRLVWAAPLPLGRRFALLLAIAKHYRRARARPPGTASVLAPRKIDWPAAREPVVSAA